jgi:peptidoglycan hydrolase-like protein with peptidoglycan-binding domain
MSLIPTPLPSSGPQVAALQVALMELGFGLHANEIQSSQFGPSTQGAVGSFRENMGLPPTAPTESPFDAAAARLINVVVPANGTANAPLEAAVHESVAAAQGAAAIEVEWLARYATIARDFTTARQAAARAPADTVITTVVKPVIGDVSFQTPNPELQNPENYYTCRFDFVPQAALDALLQGGTAPRVLIKRRRPEPQSGPEDWPVIPLGVSDPPPPPDPNQNQRLAAIQASANSWTQAVSFWQKGHREFKAQRYANAVANYDAAQAAAVEYLESFYGPNLPFDDPSAPIPSRIRSLIFDFAAVGVVPALWGVIRRRRTALTLDELQRIDWVGYSSGSNDLLQKNLQATDRPQADHPDQAEDNAGEAIIRQQVIDRFALLLAAVFAPLARAEANRMRRFFTEAINDLKSVQEPVSIDVFGGDRRRVWLTCDFIERPFARQALAEALFERAEAEYKADAPADPTQAALPVVANEKPEDWPRQGFQFATHGLRAAQTHLQIFGLFEGIGAYAERVLNGRDELASGVGDPNGPGFHSVGQNATLPTKGSNIPTVQSTSQSLPGLSRSKAPAEPWLKLVPSADGQVVSETNPRVYAMLLRTQARLEQIKHDFNYLGYPDDYVPPWRFQFLLERARYFAEHAKSAERDYLNFLNNAEHEEYQELSASQNVELEKANVRIETARVDQARQEVTASHESADLAQLNADDAATRLKNFQDFDTHMSELNSVSFASGVLSIGKGIVEIAYSGGAGAASGVSDITSGAVQTANAGKEELQRNLEENNLKLSVGEANQAARVAQAQLKVTMAGLLVSGLQRQAALLRHEFSLQNLSFLRNRQLNSEQWLRLANNIRGVSDTYLRYAIQLAFLAEQAYEFEADKRINVIRFDYDLSEVGSFLAADFLLSDLDTIDEDLVVNQRQRQQEVRYVLSMAREFPQALEDLRDNGRVTFSLRLEQIERRFPGLYNARIGSVDLLPVALLDANRYCVELRHLGSGQVRLKANPDTVSGQASTSVLNVNDLPIPKDGWLPELVNDWPIKIRISEPQTNLFSGLTRQDAAAAFPVASSGQRNAFEGLPAASAWEIDMSSRDNAIVPGTLADVLITFALSGYYDLELRGAVDEAPFHPLATTTFISARSALPDAYYSLVHQGKLEWDITDRMLTPTGSAGELRNLGVLLPSNSQGAELGRCYCRYDVELEISKTDGAVTVRSALPEFTITPNGLTIACNFTGASNAHVTWDFGDGSALASDRSIQHRYSRSGPYEVLTQIALGGRLSEYRSSIFVSQTNTVTPPLIAVPKITAVNPGPGSAPIDLKIELAASVPDISFECSIGQVRASSAPGPLVLKSIARGARVMMTFRASRNLSARFYSRQRFLPDEPVALTRMRAATNRTFTNGAETTTQPNPLAVHVFGSNPSESTLSPADRWTLELPLAANPCFLAVSSSDVAEFDGSEISDAVISLEYRAETA